MVMGSRSRPASGSSPFSFPVGPTLRTSEAPEAAIDPFPEHFNAGRVLGLAGSPMGDAEEGTVRSWRTRRPARLFRLLANVLDRPLGIVERAMVGWIARHDADPPCVFIVGPPRSGTTLLYQVLVNAYRFVYFSNLTARFPHAPALATMLAERVLGGLDPGGFRSDRGKTAGWGGPHECGAFWYRWFPRPPDARVGPGETLEDDLEELRREVLAMHRMGRAPVLFKNTYNSIRIAPLAEALPEARFLVCRRDPVDTAQSILKCRVRTHDDKEAWWSVPVPGMEELRDEPYWVQVAEQVRRITDEIDRRATERGDDRFMEVSYEALCADPHETLDRIAMFLEPWDLEDRPGPVPERFEVSTGVQVDPKDHERIREALGAEATETT